VNGSYSVTYTTSTGCESSTSSDVFSVINTAVDEGELASSTLHAWPDPTDGMVTLRVPQGAIGASITITDALGRQVLTGRAQGVDNSLDLTGLSAGTYVVHFGDGQNMQYVRVVKH
jgi:hypothetical protein